MTHSVVSKKIITANKANTKPINSTEVGCNSFTAQRAKHIVSTIVKADILVSQVSKAVSDYSAFSVKIR